MSSAMMMERTAMGMPGSAYPGAAMPGMGTTPTMPPVGTNWMMVPRCTFKFEKVSGGMKCTCTCDDKLAASMVQNLCSMLAGTMCSCCCMMNGMMVCCCNFTMGMCECKPTKDGVVLTCISGDSKCAEMIQSCCDCLASCMKAGCCCCFMMNNMPVCCGCS